MKKLTFALFLLIISGSIIPTNVFAQESKEIKTLFENGNPISKDDLGLFISPMFGFTQMDGGNTTLLNLRGGATFKNKIGVGAYYETSLNQINPQSETVQNVYMDFWSVGGFAEYSWNSSRLVHLTFPLFVGFGEVQMDNEIGNADLGESNFFKIEPSALIEVNIHRHIRFNAGVGYRFIGHMTYRNFNQSDISGLTGYAGFKFGIFR
jgi:hypothetical protein